MPQPDSWRVGLEDICPPPDCATFGSDDDRLFTKNKPSPWVWNAYLKFPLARTQQLASKFDRLKGVDANAMTIGGAKEVCVYMSFDRIKATTNPKEI